MAAASSEYTLEGAIKDFLEFRSNFVISLEFRKCIYFDQSCSVSKETLDLTVTRGTLWFNIV